MANIYDLIVKLSGDGQKLRDDIEKDKVSVDELQQALDEIRDVTATIEVDDTAAQTQIDDFKLQLATIQDEVLKINVDDAEAQAKVEELRGELLVLLDKPIDIEISADDTKALATLDEFRLTHQHDDVVIDMNLDDVWASTKYDEWMAQHDHKDVVVDIKPEVDKAAEAKAKAELGATGGGGGGLLGTILSLLPLAAPLAAGAAGGTGGLLSALTPGAAGGAGFGAVAAGTLGPVFSANSQYNQAQQQYNTLLTDPAATNGQKLAALNAMRHATDNLDSAQKKALKSAQDFGDWWTQFTQQFEGSVVTAFQKFLTLLEKLATDMTPSIQGFAGAFNTLLQDASKALGSPFWKSFFDWMGGSAKQSTMAFGLGLGNITKGLAAMLMAFDPLAKSMDVGWVKMSQSFANWASHLSASKGFQQFLDYVKQTGPQVLKLIGQLVVLVVNLLTGMAPMGALILTVATHILTWTNSMMKAHPWLKTLAAGVIAFIGAFKLISLVLSGPWGLLIAAIIAGVMLIITHWDTIKKWWSDFVGWISRLWNNTLKPFFAKWGPEILAVLMPFIGIPLVIHQHWNQISKWFSDLWDTVKNFLVKWGPDALAVILPFIGIPLLIKQHWDQIKTYFTNLWTDIKGMLNTWVTDAENFGKSIINALVSGIESGVQSAISAVGNAINSIKSAVGLGGGSSQLSVSSGVSSMVGGGSVSGTITVNHTGAVTVSGLTPKAVQQVNQQMNTQLNRKTGGR